MAENNLLSNERNYGLFENYLTEGDLAVAQEKQRASNSNKPVSAVVLDWTQSIIDGLSIIADFIIPGSGGIFDIINAIIYFIRAWTTSNAKAARGLYMCGIIQIGCILLLGPGQIYGSVLKKFVKGEKVAKPGLLKRGLIWIKTIYTNIANGVRRLGLKLLNHPAIERAFTLLGGGIFGLKYGKTKLELMKNSIEAAIVSSKKGLDELLAALPASKWKTRLSPKKIGAKALGEELGEEVVTNTLKRLRFPTATLRASGFVEGKTYLYASKEFGKASIQKITDSYVTCTLIRYDGTAIIRQVPIFEFLDNAIGQFLRNKKLWRLPKGRLIGTVVGRHYARKMYYNDGVWKFDEAAANQTPVDPNEIALTDAEIKYRREVEDSVGVIINKVYGKDLNVADWMDDPKLVPFLNELERKYQIPISNNLNDGNLAILIRDLLKRGYPKYAVSATLSLSDNRKINLIQNKLKKADAIKEMDGILQKIRTKRGG